MMRANNKCHFICCLTRTTTSHHLHHLDSVNSPRFPVFGAISAFSDVKKKEESVERENEFDTRLLSKASWGGREGNWGE